MNETALASLDRVYTCSQEVRYTTHVVQFAELRVFSVLLDKLLSGLGDNSEDEFWSSLLWPLKYFWFDICAAPLTQDYLVGRAKSLEGMLQDCQHRGAAAYPGMMPYIDALFTQVRKMSQSKLDHLLDTVVDVVKSDRVKTTALLVKQTRLIGPVEAAVEMKRQLASCQVIGLANLRDTNCYDRLMVFGLPRWYPDHVFSAPRAMEISVLKYKWMRGVWKPQAAFAEQARLTSPRAARREMAETADTSGAIDIQSLVPGLDWSTITARIRGELQSTGHEEAVEARAYVLEDDWVVFLENDQSTSVLVIDPSEIAEERVRRMELGDIEPGIYVLLRTAGGGDYVVPVADRIMGEFARLARKMQRHWKQLLREAVRSRGRTKVTRDLRRLGSSVARPINVGRWMSERNIKTRAYEDFLAIMRLVGLEGEAREYWNTMEGIHDAHARAGHNIREMLLEQVNKSDLGELKRKGILDFELSDKDAGSLTAFRIKAIASETTQVAPYRIGAPLAPGTS